jgi:hypothetical protein
MPARKLPRDQGLIHVKTDEKGFHYCLLDAQSNLQSPKPAPLSS